MGSARFQPGRTLPTQIELDPGLGTRDSKKNASNFDPGLGARFRALGQKGRGSPVRSCQSWPSPGPSPAALFVQDWLPWLWFGGIEEIPHVVGWLGAESVWTGFETPKKVQWKIRLPKVLRSASHVVWSRGLVVK